ncbi:MAG: CusA/CzcA family heavy metal efflux RND transporter [Bacteroidia bacterium]|jgi:cobalt-zinc-cadmium resistance protein CzcA|nr:CusA/CzcA family heavy metal efflux RND transporter [Bacteroidia bacterium]
MLTKIISFSIKNKLLVGLLVIALIVFGAYQTTKLPIDAVPDITNNQVQVITVAPSFGATDIERLVTFPIEQANTNIMGIKEIRSFSRFGLSLVTIVFNDETDIYWARQQVAERLQKVQNLIPKSIGTPELGPISTGLGEIYQYVLRAKEGYKNKYNETDLRTIQDWIVRRQLLGVKGVAEVSSFGGKLKQYEIAVDANKLQSYNITMQDVFTALEKNNQNTGGAYIEKGPTVLFIRSEGLIGSETDILNISIKATEGGTPLFMKDVAEVNIGYATRYGAMCYNSEGEVAGAIVMMLKGANSNEVIKNVKERISQIQTTLPEGVLLEPFLDRSKMVNQAIGTVQTNLMEGALIVVFVLVLFLGNFRAGLLVASVIPLSMLFAICLMNIFGVSGNLMSLGALDFGLIVDGAVIIVESVMHRLSHNTQFKHLSKLDQQQMDQEVQHSAGKMMNSAVFGQVIILVVYLPIFTLQGIEGKMFKPMAQTVAFALLGAFVLSLTYIPMMSAVFLSKITKHKLNISDRMMHALEGWYDSTLQKALRFPKTILLSVLLLFATAIVTLGCLGGEFIPALEEGDFAVDTRVLTGSSISTTIENTQKTAHILKTRFPEVEMVVTKIGSGEVPTDPMPMEASDMMVILKSKEEWTSAKSFPELAEKMSKALEEVPGVTASFQFPVQMRFNELMTGARQDVVLKLFGEDLDSLAKYAHLIGNVVNTVEGAKNLFVEKVTGMPQVIIEYNRAAIAQYNLTIADINRVVNTAFAGQSAGLVFEGEKRFDVVVRLKGDKRNTLNDIQNLLIPTPEGTQLPLYQLANVEIKNGPNQIQREDAKRRIVVGFNVRGRDVQSIVNELQQKLTKQLKFPSGYYLTYGGAFENLTAAKQRLMIAVPVSLILIFLLLYFAFNSLRQGMLIYSAIPLSAIGGIFFLALRGMPFSISAGVGFIALFGVAVLNGIVLIAEFNRLKKEGTADLKENLILGAKLRLRPVLMTAFVASLGFLPMALSNGAGAEVQRPLATVVIGGLLLSTLLTLFVLPVLYLMFEKKSITNIKAHVMVLLVLGLLPYAGKTQVPISLQAAIDTALHNNLVLKNEQLRTEYLKKLTQAAANTPKTMVSGEFGQINSNYTDNRFGLTQSFEFPLVYIQQKQVYTEEWKVGQLNVQLKEADVKCKLRQTFFSYLYLKEKEKLLLTYDSIYTSFLEKATNRFVTGESNVLEKTIAQNQKGAVMIQLKQIQQHLEVMRLEFMLALNAPGNYVPYQNKFRLETELSPDPTLLIQHPILKLMAQEKNVAASKSRLERAKLMPDFNLGYFNMSMQGFGADEKYYTNSRFQSLQIGLGIPLFFGAQKAIIKASRIEQDIAELKYLQESLALQNRYAGLIGKYRTNTETVEYYEKQGLKNASLIRETANKQLLNGEINYLEWVILNNQVILVQLAYLDAIRDMNETQIQINYLLNK